jgi:hypothetical protein
MPVVPSRREKGCVLLMFLVDLLIFPFYCKHFRLKTVLPFTICASLGALRRMAVIYIGKRATEVVPRASSIFQEFKWLNH